jgi:hypothetical protein
MQVDIVARRVTSEENRADGLYRGETEGHALKDRVLINVPEDLVLYFTQ